MNMMPIIFVTILIFATVVTCCHGWIVTTNPPLKSRMPPSSSNIHPNSRHLQASLFEEPDNEFGRMTYWDQSYRESLVENKDKDEDNSEHKNVGTATTTTTSEDDDNAETETFSWYCGWENELEPFFTELVPPNSNSTILIPGIGNDACIRDMFDAGYVHLSAFDYAPEGVECANRMFGPERVELMDDLRVADARSLPYGDVSFDAVLEKGTLDSIYLSGGKDKVLSKKHLGMAVSELARVVKEGGIVFSVTAACVDAVQLAFDECNELKGCWRQIRDGGLYMTDDGYTSNNVDATMLVWERI